MIKIFILMLLKGNLSRHPPRYGVARLPYLQINLASVSHLYLKQLIRRIGVWPLGFKSLQEVINERRREALVRLVGAPTLLSTGDVAAP